jgi:hypothetical protein
MDFEFFNVLLCPAYDSILKFTRLTSAELAIEPCNELEPFLALLKLTLLNHSFWRVNCKSYYQNPTENGDCINEMQIGHSVFAHILNVGAEERYRREVEQEKESRSQV